jgi:hypothetical protein
MSKPNPDQFAKVVLHHLAGLRADVLVVEAQLDEMRGRMPEMSPDLRKQLRSETQARLYREALQEVGLQDSSQPPSPPTVEL